MAEFDLAKLMQDVSRPETGKQQIRYISLDLIDPDPDNFYSLDGLEELAGSIEMLGLQQPLLVRPAKGGRYIVISGHRRRSALLLIRDGGSSQFADGVPCIVDTSSASAALQELKLIMANFDTRKMTSADQNKQAERIEDILRQLEDEGFEITGRRRDWAAKLSGMSRSKLARLKVIRDKLDRKVKKDYYDKGRLKEEPAYELARLPEDVQHAVIAWFKSRDTKPEYWYANTIKQYAEDYQRVAGYTCPAKYGGMVCVNQPSLMERIWKDGLHGGCHCARGKGCCADCDELASCRRVCGHMLPKAEKLRKERRAKNKEINKKIKEAEKKAQQPIVDRIRTIWLRFGNALGRANMEDEDLRKATGHKIYQLDSTQIAALEAGEYAPKVKAGTVLPFYNSCYTTEIDRYIAVADALDCSIDYLFCRTDVPEVNRQQAAPKQEVSLRFLGWLTCTPPDGVRAWAKFMGEGSEDIVMLAHYHADSETWYSGISASPWGEIDQKCIGWWPLPDDNAMDLPGDLTPQPVSSQDTPPTVAEPAPAWQTGKPEKAGVYAVRFKVSKTAPGELHNFAVWDNFQWKAVRSGKVITDLIAAGWYPLPALENTKEVTEK